MEHPTQGSVLADGEVFNSCPIPAWVQSGGQRGLDRTSISGEQLPGQGIRCHGQSLNSALAHPEAGGGGKAPPPLQP